MLAFAEYDPPKDAELEEFYSTAEQYLYLLQETQPRNIADNVFTEMDDFFYQMYNTAISNNWDSSLQYQIEELQSLTSALAYSVENSPSERKKPEFYSLCIDLRKSLEILALD